MALVSHSLPHTSRAITTSHNPSPQRNLYCKASAFCHYNRSPFSHQPLTHTRTSPRHNKGILPVPFSAKNSEPGEEDSQAVETILRFYTAIKNKNVHELSDIIGDECRCVCNFFSNFQQPLQGKKQVLEFLSHLIRNLGNKLGFVVILTRQHGMTVHIKWKLEFFKTHIRLGNGFSFHMSHVYRGKVVISNVEMLLEPFLQIQPLRQKIMQNVTIIMEDKTTFVKLFRDKKRNKRAILLTLYFMITLLFLYNFSS